MYRRGEGCRYYLLINRQNAEMGNLASTLIAPQSVFERLSLDQILLFTELCWQLKTHIIFYSEYRQNDEIPPLSLPTNVVSFLGECLSTPTLHVSPASVKQLWDTLSRKIWNTERPTRSAVHCIEYFIRYGVKYEIGMMSF